MPCRPCRSSGLTPLSFGAYLQPLRFGFEVGVAHGIAVEIEIEKATGEQMKGKEEEDGIQ